MEITGRTKLLDERNNLWGFEMETSSGKRMLCDKHFSSSIAIAIDEIARALGVDTIEDGKLVKITIESLE